MSLLNSLYEIVERQQSEEKSTFVIRFNASHPVFAGHFPGHPVVPGACLIQIAEELASLRAGHTVRLTAVRNVKFRQPVSPDRQVTITIEHGKIEIESYMCAGADIQ